MKYFSFLILSVWSLIAPGQQAVKYELTPSNLAHHEIQIAIHFSDVDEDTLTIVMPNSSPGRYAIHR